MASRKKIISIVLKAFIGIAGFAVIFLKLKEDLTTENLSLIRHSASSLNGLLCLLACLLLIPVNWVLESYKWKCITAPVEKISLLTAQKSVYSGICLGNLAPGRATEFLAKIIFFKSENRPAISVLHFVNGMFQLSITYLFGFLALSLKINSFAADQSWIAYTSFSLSILVLIVFSMSLIKIDKLLHFVTRKILKEKNLPQFHFQFKLPLLFTLFSVSIFRYLVFSMQMLLLIFLYSGQFSSSIFIGTALYFLLTTSIPMISFLEAPIRAAIALVVYKDCGVNDSALAFASVSVWIANIIFPSILGYVFLLRQNFNFKLSRTKR